MCVFAKHNVAADPPFSRMDLISCRNLLIYLALPLQKLVIPTFHYALNPGGFLLLGASETIGVFTDLFGCVDQSLRIYCKKAASMREYRHFIAKGFPAISKNISSVPAVINPTDWYREADRVVLTKYVPPGVLVNDNLDILQFRGKTSPYLESPSGEPSHKLLRMACEGLFPTLHNAIEECRKQNITVRRRGMRIRKDEQMREVDIQVFPVTLSNSSEICFLILFEECKIPVKNALSIDNIIQDSSEVIMLRQELSSMHEYLQSVIEEKDAINEELRATIEESLSSNEELQSTNEELETAKEELQSVNEELTTVNEQLNQRNKELNNINDKLQEARDYAEAIVKTVREPLIVLDASLRVQTANPAFYKTFHVTAEETKNNLFYEIGNNQWDIPQLRHSLNGIIPEKKTLEDFEVQQNFKDIGSKTMLLNACSVVRRNNEIPLLLLAIEDISERKRLEEGLQEFSQKLKEVDRQKDEFIATLSHELRNPLAPMRNALEILRLPGKNIHIAAQSYEIIDYQLTQMVRLVDDLLDVSRIASGKIELRREHVELSKIIKSAVETSRSLIEDAKHKLTVILPPEQLWLDADASRIAQVISNLLNNSAKYTKNNGIITLSVERKENYVLVRVKDNGIGLSAEMLPHIFEMFSQADTSIERAKGGMGVGLALVKSLVELHGGSIAVTSVGIEYGAEFTVSLPLVSVPDNINIENTSASISEKNSLKNNNSMRVLVVDDNKDSCQTLGWLLELALGYEVQLAYDGLSAILLAKNFIPDVMLLDIGLPGMDGYKICHAMRQEPVLKNTVIIAQTGWGQEEHLARSKEAGFDYHLVKPISLEDLREVFDSIATHKKIPLAHTG